MKVFSHNDQINFAELSGDYNPMHIDPIVARRLMYGKQVVHGVHGLLWALDNFISSLDGNIRLTSIGVVFQKPVKIEDTEISFKADQTEDNKATITVSNDSEVFQKINIQWEAIANVASDGYTKGIAPKLPCETPDINTIEGHEDELELYFDAEKGAKLFPNLTSKMAHKQIAQLLASTRLVGMVIPGLNSIYSQLQLRFTEISETENTFKYNVASADERFSMVRISIGCTDASGTIAAFFRPQSAQQLSYNDAKTKVATDTFKGQRVLIIGGSRGIGEVTTKLLAAGGADVKFTYNSGKADAELIVKETENKTAALQYNVLGDDSKELEELLNNWKPTHLYYYATPFIQTSDTEEINERIYQKFLSFYVTGFEKLMGILKSNSALPTAVFYPSSVFVEEVPDNLKEYAKAKAEGEAVCKKWQEANPQTTIFAPRIPKVATDQTASLFDDGNDDTTEVTLNYINQFITGA